MTTITRKIYLNLHEKASPNEVSVVEQGSVINVFVKNKHVHTVTMEEWDAVLGAEVFHKGTQFGEETQLVLTIENSDPRNKKIPVTEVKKELLVEQN